MCPGKISTVQRRLERHQIKENRETNRGERKRSIKDDRKTRFWCSWCVSGWIWRDQGGTVSQAVMLQLSQLLPLTPAATGGFRALNLQRFHVVHAEFIGIAG